MNEEESLKEKLLREILEDEPDDESEFYLYEVKGKFWSEKNKKLETAVFWLEESEPSLDIDQLIGNISYSLLPESVKGSRMISIEILSEESYVVSFKPTAKLDFVKSYKEL